MRTCPASAWKFFAVWVGALMLGGCPLFDDSDQRDPASARLSVEGPGVRKTGTDAYGYQLDSSTNPDNTLSLKATMQGRTVELDAPPVSSHPDVVRVEGVDRLVAIKAGDAQIQARVGGSPASLSLRVEAGTAVKGGFQVKSAEFQSAHGPIKAAETDNYKYGNGGMADDPEIHAVVLGPDGRPVSKDECSEFVTHVTPQVVPSGWPADDREMGGVVRFNDNIGWTGESDAAPDVCAFGFRASGFPIIGSGTKRFTMSIYRKCNGKACGKPLPGGVIPFEVRMQSMQECSYCKHR